MAEIYLLSIPTANKRRIILFFVDPDGCSTPKTFTSCWPSAHLPFLQENVPMSLFCLLSSNNWFSQYSRYGLTLLASHLATIKGMSLNFHHITYFFHLSLLLIHEYMSMYISKTVMQVYIYLMWAGWAWQAGAVNEIRHWDCWENSSLITHGNVSCRLPQSMCWWVTVWGDHET